MLSKIRQTYANHSLFLSLQEQANKRCTIAATRVDQRGLDAGEGQVSGGSFVERDKRDGE
jgi:hypothetical protein